MSATVAKILLGLDAEDMTASIETKEYCRVTLYNGGQFPNGDPYYVTYPVESSSATYYESGDLVRSKDQDTGDELVMDCAWLDSGTQGEAIGLQGKKIAKAIYNRIVGKQYKPFISNNAILNPLAEIGDGVLVNGHYAPIYRRVAYLDQLYTADISAPYKEEEDEEYPYEAKSVTEFERSKKSIYGVRTSLTVTDGKIEQIVQSVGEDGEVTAASIVTAINDSDSSVVIKADHITLQGSTTFVSNIENIAASEASDAVDGLANDLSSSSGTTTIDGAHIITGTIDADRLSTRISQVSDNLYIGDEDEPGNIYLGTGSSYDFFISTNRFGVGYVVNFLPIHVVSDHRVYLEGMQGCNFHATHPTQPNGDFRFYFDNTGRYWLIDREGIFYVENDGTKMLKCQTVAVTPS